MKRLLVIICSLLFLCLPVFTVSAAAISTTDTSLTTSFEIKDVVGYAKIYGIRNDDAVTKVPINLSVNKDINTELVVEIEPRTTRASGVLNFNVSGSFYRTSDHVTVSVYGLSGSFEYTSNDTKITGKDSYHNSTADGWSGTSRTSSSKEDSYHMSILKGDYTLLKDKKENNTAWIKIAVTEGGQYSVGGDYVSYNVN